MAAPIPQSVQPNEYQVFKYLDLHMQYILMQTSTSGVWQCHLNLHSVMANTVGHLFVTLSLMTYRDILFIFLLDDALYYRQSSKLNWPLSVCAYIPRQKTALNGESKH